MSEIEVCKHAEKAIRKRIGIPKKAVVKLANEAFDNGLSIPETSGSLNRYLTKQYYKNKNMGKIKVYSEYVFFFSNQKVLVTVYHSPKRYTEQTHKKERNNDN